MLLFDERKSSLPGLVKQQSCRVLGQEGPNVPDLQEYPEDIFFQKGGAPLPFSDILRQYLVQEAPEPLGGESWPRFMASLLSGFDAL